MIIFFWIVDLIMPITMLWISVVYKKKSRMKRSAWSGFRTSKSMESQENWKLHYFIYIGDDLC